MMPHKYQLYINGRDIQGRGLDLAYNPHNGQVLGEVVLVADSLLRQIAEDEEEDTLMMSREVAKSLQI